MSRLMVVYKKRNSRPFHPTIRIENTGYDPHHWTAIHFRPELTCGYRAVWEVPKISDVIAKYFADLERMGYKVVSE